MENYRAGRAGLCEKYFKRSKAQNCTKEACGVKKWNLDRYI